MSFRHWACLIALALAVAIQWPLWFGRGGVLRMQALEAELTSVRAANDRLRAENDAVAAEIESLENGSGAVEERARMRLGMIKSDEILFRLVPKGQDKTKLPPPLRRKKISPRAARFSFPSAEISTCPASRPIPPKQIGFKALPKLFPRLLKVETVVPT